MHTTTAGEKRKALLWRARKLEREAGAILAAEGLDHEARARQEEAERLRAEAEGLKATARLEDLHLWRMESIKDTRKGPKTYSYWMATWREGGRVRNVYLGSCRRVSHEQALQKARGLKKGALGVRITERRVQSTESDME